MTKVMFILSSIFSGLELWSIEHTLIHENSELKVFKNINFLGKISNNFSKNLLGTNVYKALESCL